MKKLPATVLSGFFGAEKRILLNKVLNNRKDLKVAVIVNDMSEVNIDADLIKQNENPSFEPSIRLKKGIKHASKEKHTIWLRESDSNRRPIG